MPEPARSALRAEGTAAVWLVPVIDGDGWWGFVGIDAVSPRAVDRGRWGRRSARWRAQIGDAVQRARVRTEQLRSQDRFRSIVEDGPLVSYIDAPDEAATAVYVSPQIEELIGYTPEEWLADPDLWPRILHPDDRARALAENARHNETGEPFRAGVSDAASRRPRRVGARSGARRPRRARQDRCSHGVMLDITSRKRADEQLAFRTYHDELTGLPSREMFEELVELSVARARRHEGAVAVLCVDLVDFRLVNDSLGHQAGDGLLVAVADRLREATRETDLVARRGGDQFLLLLADLDRDETGPDGAVLRAESVAQRIHESLADAVQRGRHRGLHRRRRRDQPVPRDAEDPAALQRNAETAMFEAKRTGGTNYVLSGGAEADSGARLHFVTRLRKAVDAQRWALHYQPVIDLADGRMVGVEALIRWIEPDGTIIPPNDFIPLAEELGLIERIGDWVVRELTYQVSAWQELDIDLEVGFNLSPRQFWQPDLAERIQQEFRTGGVDPVEGARRGDRDLRDDGSGPCPGHPAGADRRRVLDRDRRLRHRVLVPVPPSSHAGAGAEDRPVVRVQRPRGPAGGVDRRGVPRARDGLDLVTLAEGIETAEELAFLRERGCKLGQGFYFSKPVPPEEIIAYAFGGIPTAVALRGA